MRVKMRCIKCNDIVEWYSMGWHEVMQYKFSDKEFLCVDCAAAIALTAYEDFYLSKGKQSGNRIPDRTAPQNDKTVKLELGGV